MTVHRRTFLSVTATGAAGLGLLGAGQALAAIGPSATAPTTPFAVGVRRYDWTRGSRPCTTYVYYPGTGAAGGNPVTNAPAADGVLPVHDLRLAGHHQHPRPQRERTANRARQHEHRRWRLGPLPGRHDHPRPAHLPARQPDRRSPAWTSGRRSSASWAAATPASGATSASRGPSSTGPAGPCTATPPHATASRPTPPGPTPAGKRSWATPPAARSPAPWWPAQRQGRRRQRGLHRGRRAARPVDGQRQEQPAVRVRGRRLRPRPRQGAPQRPVLQVSGTANGADVNRQSGLAPDVAGGVDRRRRPRLPVHLHRQPQSALHPSTRLRRGLPGRRAVSAGRRSPAKPRAGLDRRRRTRRRRRCGRKSR